MEQLDDAEQYASGALFTLALYSTAVESGITQNAVGNSDGTWAVHFDDVVAAYCEPNGRNNSDDCFRWGWQVVSPGGLCGRVFRALDISASACPGLLTLPDTLRPLTDISNKDALMRMVETYAHHLDPSLEFSLGTVDSALHRFTKDGRDANDATTSTPIPLDMLDTAEVQTPADDSPSHHQRVDSNSVHAGGQSGDDSPPDVHSSLLDDPLQERSGPPSHSHEPTHQTTAASVTVNPDADTPSKDGALGASNVSATAHSALDSEAQSSTALAGAAPFTREDMQHEEEEALRKALMALQQDPAVRERIQEQNHKLECSATLTEGSVFPEPAFAPAPVYAHHASPKCLTALSLILSGCISETLPVAAASEKQPNRTARWYDSRGRSACIRLAHWLCIPAGTMKALEAAVISERDERAVNSLSADDPKLRSYHSSYKKWIKMGAAAVGGGALMAVTAGLAAPALVAGIGAAVGMTGSAGAAAAIAGAAGTTTSLGIVSGGMGAAGAAHFSSRMAHRAGDVQEFGFVALLQWDSWKASVDEKRAADAAAAPPPAVPHAQRGDDRCEEARGEGPAGTEGGKAAGKKKSWKEWARIRAKNKPKVEAEVIRGADGSVLSDPLRNLLPVPLLQGGSGSVLIAVNGWLGAREDFVTPFRALDRRKGDAFALVWESRELLELSVAFMKMLAKGAGQQVVQYALSTTTMAGLASAIVWPVAVLGCASFIDSAWDVASNRAQCGGKLLAHMLMARLHGDRPVTLLGVSLGARLVYYCCLELYKHGAFGVIENAVLLGAPVSVDSKRWRMARCAVSGRFINGYTVADWLLTLCYRTQITGQGAFAKIAGLRPVLVPGVEDMDFSEIVQGHGDWCKNMDSILQILRLQRD